MFTEKRWGRGMLLVVITLLAVLFAAGCASFNATTYQSENLAADAATSSTHAFNMYMAQTMPTASDVESNKLLSAQAQVYEADRKLSATLSTVESLRAEYATNSSSTNQAAILLTLQSLNDQASNIVSLVRVLMNKGVAAPIPGFTTPGVTPPTLP